MFDLGGTISQLTYFFWGVTQKVLSNSKHTLQCLCGHNVLARIKPNTIENTAEVRSVAGGAKPPRNGSFSLCQRLKTKKNRRMSFPLMSFLGMNKNVFLHVIRFIPNPNARFGLKVHLIIFTFLFGAKLNYESCMAKSKLTQNGEI